MKNAVFNKAQIEMLDLMSRIDSEEELLEIKKVISEYFMRKADEELDTLWEDGTFNENKMEELRYSHLRTPYSR